MSEPNTPATVNYSAVAMSGMRKKAAPKTKVVRACQLKPPAARTVDTPEGPVLQRQIVYVTDQGQEIANECSAQLFAAIEDGRLDQEDKSDFLIHITTDGLAVRVEPVIRQEFTYGLTPTTLENVKLISFLVSATNGFATLKEYPAKTDREIVIEMKQELDAAEAITVGMRLLGRFPVVEVREGVGDCTVYVDPKPRT